jgi:hypothetical protein
MTSMTRSLLRAPVVDRLELFVHLARRGCFGGPSITGNGYGYIIRSLPPPFRARAQKFFTRLRRMAREQSDLNSEFYALAMEAVGKDFSLYRAASERCERRRVDDDIGERARVQAWLSKRRLSAVPKAKAAG